MTPQWLLNRRAVVTGGARGLGAAISKTLLEASAQVVVVGQSEQSYSDFVRANESYKQQIEFIKCDLADEAQVVSLAAQLKNLNVDILVNNAGINKIALAHEVDLKDWDRIQFINIKAPMMLSQAVLPSMMDRSRGRIVNIASIFGEITKSKRLSYTASKSALIGVTKAFAVDYAAYNILVNCISPGFLDTELTRTVLTKAEIENLVQQIPMKRLGQVDEISRHVLFLCSDFNTYMTGQNLILDGGFSIV